MLKLEFGTNFPIQYQGKPFLLRTNRTSMHFRRSEGVKAQIEKSMENNYEHWILQNLHWKQWKCTYSSMIKVNQIWKQTRDDSARELRWCFLRELKTSRQQNSKEVDGNSEYLSYLTATWKKEICSHLGLKSLTDWLAGVLWHTVMLITAVIEAIILMVRLY